VGNTNNSRAPARTSAVAFPNKVSITGTPRFLGGGGVKYGGGPGIFGRMFGGGKKKTNAPRTNAPKANTPNVPKKPNAPKTNDPKKPNAPNVPKKPNAPNVPKKPNAPTPPPAPPVPGRPMVTVNNLTKGKKLITVKAHLKTKSKLTNVEKKQFENKVTKNTNVEVLKKEINAANAAKPNTPKTNVPKKPNAPTPPAVPGRPTANNLVKQRKLITVKAHLGTKTKLTNVEKKQFMNKVTKNTNVEVLKKEINAANAAKPNVPNPAAKKRQRF